MKNNMMKKLMMTGIACVALCGTTLAAPKHNNGPAPKGKAPVVQVAKPMPKPAARPMAKPAQHHVVKAPVRHHEVRPAHRMPPPRPITPCHHHHRHDCHDCHYDDNGWVELGAGIIGGIIGALIAG